MKEKALEYLSGDILLNIDMTECIRRGLCEVLYADNDGVLIRADSSGAYMLSCDSEEAALKITAGRDINLLVLHQMEQKAAVCGALGLRAGDECFQGAYIKMEPLAEEDADIRCLDERYAEKVGEAYTMYTIEHIRELLEQGIIYGLFDGERLAGFIGWHDEGAQGMLHVFPEYRRRGFAEALEKHLINIDVQRGFIPFGQLFTWNEASRRLQEKLGMSFSDGRICWLWKEKE